jgi:hypothetical protein
MQLWGNLIHIFWTFLFVASCWDYVCPLRQRNLSDLEKAFDGVNGEIKHSILNEDHDFDIMEHLDSKKQHDFQSTSPNFQI